MQLMVLASQLFLLPFYVRILGVESYALVGIYISLQGVFVMFDLGMSTTINQEMAKTLAHKENKQNAVDLLRTFEWIYWILAILLFFIVYFIIPFFTNEWKAESSIANEELKSNLILISILIVLRFPISFYTGALNGMQQQYKMNIVSIVLELFKFSLIVFVITYIHKSIQVFFLVNIAITILQLAILKWIIYSNFKHTEFRARFRKKYIYNNWKFSLGISLVSIAAILVSQSDKLILGKMVSMTDFSYYALAFSIASIPSKIYSAIAAAFYPQLVHEKTLAQGDNLKLIYHRSCQLISILVIPVVVIAFFFMPELLNIWFGGSITSQILTPLVRVLIIGFTLNGFVTMPYYLQLVHRWTRLSFYKNLIAMVILLPSLYFSILNYGIYGACWIWLMLNLMYFVFEIPIMHRKIMKTEQAKYYLEDIGKILISSLFFTGILFLGIGLFEVNIYVLLIILIVAGIIQVILLNKISSERPLGKFSNYSILN